MTEAQPVELAGREDGTLSVTRGQMYRQDLANIHDTAFGGFARDAAPGVLAIIKGAGIHDGRVVDLGCGSGLWARHLVDASYDVTGVDISPDMIQIARQRVPEGEFHTGSFLHTDLPPCVAVTSLGECFNYLFDPDNNRRELKRMFRRVYQALRPGGLFVFDVIEPGHSQGFQPRFWKGSDWACLVEYAQDRRRNRLTRCITTFRKRGRCYHRDEEVHVQQLYKATHLASDLRCIGFRTRVVRGFGGLRFSSTHAGLVARKP